MQSTDFLGLFLGYGFCGLFFWITVSQLNKVIAAEGDSSWSGKAGTPQRFEKAA